VAGDAARDLGGPGAVPGHVLEPLPGRYFAGDGAKLDDDGYLWLLGRVDDVMNVSGHRISTTEVESALVAHPSVAEAAVVGANDPTTGQAIIAYVTLRGGLEVDEQVLRNHVATEIGAIAKPKTIYFTPDLPKTRSGKIMRGCSATSPRAATSVTRPRSPTRAS
jgi:acetyl-CoA synthetase